MKACSKRYAESADALGTAIPLICVDSTTLELPTHMEFCIFLLLLGGSGVRVETSLLERLL